LFVFLNITCDGSTIYPRGKGRRRENISTCWGRGEKGREKGKNSCTRSVVEKRRKADIHLRSQHIPRLRVRDEGVESQSRRERGKVKESYIRRRKGKQDVAAYD